MVVPEAGFPKSMDMMFFLSVNIGVVCLCMRGNGRWEMIFFLVFAVQNDRPSWRENIVLSLEVVTLEANATEDRRNGQSLTIRQVYGRGCHC